MFKTVLFGVLTMYAASALAQSAQEIVAAADKVRNAEQSSRSTLVLTEYVSGQERSHSTFVLFSKEDSAGNFRNLLQYVEPPRDAGKRVLLDGRSYWFFDPASQSSVRISAQRHGEYRRRRSAEANLLAPGAQGRYGDGRVQPRRVLGRAGHFPAGQG